MKSNQTAAVQNPRKSVRDQAAKKKRFQIVKLEQRIAPKLSANHNETLMRDLA